MGNEKPSYEELERKVSELENFIENHKEIVKENSSYTKDVVTSLSNKAPKNSDYLVDGKYSITDLLDIEKLRYIFEKFTQSTGFTIGFLDHPDLNILVATGWRDICTKFHRGCKASEDICTKSNLHLLNSLSEPKEIKIEACENGLVDCATPIIIKGKHIASLATGQLLLEMPDIAQFKKQALMYGFDERAYLDALKEIPIVSREALSNITLFLGEIASVISEMGYTNLVIKEDTFKLEMEIGERKLIELKLENQNKQLQRINKELEQFAFISSHDLQEPLRTLACFAELIKNEYAGKLTGNGEKYLEYILESSERMKMLIENLLEYSRIGKERKITLVDCNEIVNNVLSDMGILIKESNAKITVQNLPLLNGYKIELSQLFKNLLNNAIKFGKHNINPEITIYAEQKDKMWRFAVKDNGIGIDEKDKEKIFVIFKRLHNRHEYEGSGIGLSFCKKIVELHNGSIWVESKINEGSIIYFTLQ